MLRLNTVLNDQTVNWLLFSAGLVAAFGGQLAHISRYSKPRVPDGPGGKTQGPRTLGAWRLRHGKKLSLHNSYCYRKEYLEQCKAVRQ
jgi:hypothetical protein